MLRIIFAALILAGCTVGTTKYPVIPDQKLVVAAGQGGTVSITSLAAVGIAYAVYDPLAPNWEITETRLDERTFRMDLEMKRFNTGGDGDALWIVKRRAKQLQAMAGLGGFRISSFEQRIDSQTIGARREAEAMVVLLAEYVPPTAVAAPDILPVNFASPVKSASKASASKKTTSKSAQKTETSTATNAGLGF